MASVAPPLYLEGSEVLSVGDKVKVARNSDQTSKTYSSIYRDAICVVESIEPLRRFPVLVRLLDEGKRSQFAGMPCRFKEEELRPIVQEDAPKKPAVRKKKTSKKKVAKKKQVRRPAKKKATKKASKARRGPKKKNPVSTTAKKKKAVKKRSRRVTKKARKR